MTHAADGGPSRKPRAWHAAGVPNPGSNGARAVGCTCPVMDNSHGLGRYGDGKKYGWWQAGNCPLHGYEPEPEAP